MADLVLGADGSMNREAPVLGRPTYTVFAGRLAAVDAELIRLGRMHDLRDPELLPRFEKGCPRGSATARSEPIVGAILGAPAAAAR